MGGGQRDKPPPGQVLSKRSGRPVDRARLPVPSVLRSGLSGRENEPAGLLEILVLSR